MYRCISKSQLAGILTMLYLDLNIYNIYLYAWFYLGSCTSSALRIHLLDFIAQNQPHGSERDWDCWATWGQLQKEKNI